MSQITKAAQVKPRTSDEFYGRAITATFALAAAIVVAAFLLTRPATVPSSSASASDVTDGFLPGAMGAHAAQQIRQAQAVTDGWEARLAGPIGAAPTDVRDGWEGRLVPAATSPNNITDGWESSLFK
jgi:hypothetical protein